MDLYAYDLDTARKNYYKKWIAFCISFIILIMAASFLIVDCVYAVPVVQVETRGQTFIEWNFSEPIEYILVDGQSINNFNTTSDKFILTGIESNTKHNIIAVNIAGETGKNSAYTLPQEEKSTDKIADFFFDYLLLFVSLTLLIIGIRVPIVGAIGTVFSLMGLISALPKGNFILDLIFSIGMVAGVCITYIGVKR